MGSGLIKTACLCLLLAAGCAGDDQSAQTPVIESGVHLDPDVDLERPNVVLIVMDTARQDRLSCFGYCRDTSPNLQSLAATSTTYYNAYSTTSWTGPAHASLFTGLFPIAHGSTQEQVTVSTDLVTMAEILTEHGYKTVGIIENPMLAGDLGFAQGFSTYHETWRIKDEPQTGNIALDLFVKTLSDNHPPGRFFIFVNLVEPHSPYNSSRQFYERFLTDRSLTVEDNMWREYYVGKRLFTEIELRHLNELYDAELLFTDYVVGKMIDELRTRGHWENTVFIVTSDHGENIGDHGHMDHVFSLYETTLKIPLIIHYPTMFGNGLKEYRPVQITDVLPTVLGVVGIDKGRYPSQGRDLLSSQLVDGREIFGEYYYPKQAIEAYGSDEERNDPRLTKYKRGLRSVNVNGVKFIWGSDGKHELYDLNKDPRERTNLIDDEAYSETRDALERSLLELVMMYMKEAQALAPGKSIETLDDETRRALRSLGYLK